jgi:hypothetical protein
MAGGCVLLRQQVVGTSMIHHHSPFPNVSARRNTSFAQRPAEDACVPTEDACVPAEEIFRWFHYGKMTE